MKDFKLFYLLLFCVLAIGCSEVETINHNSNDQPKTGVFLDSAVEGLYYETSTQSGFTNNLGEFVYQEGEIITFFLGDFELGRAKADLVLSPISIAQTPKANIYTPEVQYMAALLQTLDIDGNAKNGIKLEPRVLEALDEDLIRGRENARVNILEVVKRVREKTGIDLTEKFPEQAASHLAETLGENYQLYASLLPVLESTVNPFEPISSVSWDHQVNDEGLLFNSIRYENNPYRISAVYDYTEYREDGYPLKMEITKYNLGEPAFTISKEIIYNEERQAIGFKNFDANGALISISTFEAINTDGYVTDIKVQDQQGEFLYRETFERNENGNVSIHNRYSSESSTEIDDLEIRYEFSFTESGDLLQSKQLRPNFRNIKSDYIYRDDNTLKQKNTLILLLDQNRISSREDFYDEQEKLIAFNIIQGDWRSEYLELYPDGDPKLVYTYYQDWLQEVATFDEDGYGELVIQHLDRSGSYQIDFRDPSYNLIKIEYYDDNGNYEKTEYYENNELVRTEYV
ncbi:hypothetical protein ML462_14805 [Gramella lutea]|uniref:Uncharacterized protein n=1 Tax=Christiangramia lutea TaxID=1607951 RepID=A0A9X2AAF4_9FLAO|nr:hypothetical protein [Christiangramia lutea]MCH4824440.1 hypothetical protein [Christiangramia lutea]